MARVSLFSPERRHEAHVCLKKPVTRAALFVISVLFAVGAIIAHFNRLGVGVVVSLSIPSACFMAVFIATCLCKSTRKHN